MLQPLNGVVFVGEGLMQGHQAFLRLAAGMFVSTGAMLIALNLYGDTPPSVWFCFTVFNTFRLFFGVRHHFFDGPLAPRNIDATVAAFEAEHPRQGGVRQMHVYVYSLVSFDTQPRRGGV